MLLLIWKKKPWPSSQYGYFAYFGLYSKLFVTRILVLARCYGFTWQESVYSINTLVLPRGWVGKTVMFWSEILKDVNCFPIQYERRKTHFEFKTVITCRPSTFLLKIFKTFMLYIFYSFCCINENKNINLYCIQWKLKNHLRVSIFIQRSTKQTQLSGKWKHSNFNLE